MLYWIIFGLTFIPLCLILPVKVFGKNNIKKKQNYIIVFNHQSNFDGIIINFKLKKHVRYLAKIELWKGKKRSFVFDAVLGCVPIDRSKGISIESTKKILNLLKNKKNIGIAPTGTRNIENEENVQVKNGACMLAIKSRTPILPVYIHKKQRAFCKNTMVVGKPFELEEFYSERLTKEILAKACKVMQEKMCEVEDGFKSFEKEKMLIKSMKKQKSN